MGNPAVDAIATAQTGRRPPHADVPVEDVVLISAKIE